MQPNQTAPAPKTTAELKNELNALKAQGYDLVVAKEQVDQQLAINGQQINQKAGLLRASIEADKAAQAAKEALTASKEQDAKLNPATTTATGSQLNTPSPLSANDIKGGQLGSAPAGGVPAK